jgi:hypothetical protein
MSEVAPPTAAPAKKRRFHRLGFLLAGLVLVPLLLLAALYFYVKHLASVDLQEALAETDRLDPGWRFDDLQAGRPVYADDDNSAVQLVRIKALIPNGWAAQKEFTALFTGPPNPHQLDAAQWKALQQEMAKAAAALTEARKLADLPHGRFPLQPRVLASSLKAVLNTRDPRAVIDLLHYDVLMLAQEGDLDGALRSTRGVVNAGRSIGDEPAREAQLLRMACRGAAVGSLERVLSQGEPPPAALADLQHLLEEDEAENLVLYGARGDRAVVDHFLEGTLNGNLTLADFLGPTGVGMNKREAFATALLASSSSLESQRAGMLRFTSQIVEAAKRPPEQQPQEIKRIDADLPNQVLLVQMIAPRGLKVTEANQHNLALLRCAIVALAAERYRQAHHAWPVSGPALVADGQLKQVPHDPYDGAPLRYRVREDRLLIYSVSRDLQDNGGTFDGKAGMTPGTDVGFTLWEVAQRRLLPLPVAETTTVPDDNSDQADVEP